MPQEPNICSNICDHCGQDAGLYPVYAAWPGGPGRMALICEHRECLSRVPIQKVDGNYCNVYIPDYDQCTLMDNVVLGFADVLNRNGIGDDVGFPQRTVGMYLWNCLQAFISANREKQMVDFEVTKFHQASLRSKNAANS